jgi:Rv0078B-related antitoxin
MTLTDANSRAEGIQLARVRAMTGEQRLKLAFDISAFARDFSKARIRREHPDWTGEQVNRELMRICCQQ